MNANGVTSNTAAAGYSSPAGASPASGKTGSSNGFAGALDQAMDGTGANGSLGSEAGAPTGLLGLLSLIGTPLSQQPNQDLLDLLTGLSDQLSMLDQNSELPSELQDQLAALLLMFQNMLKQAEIGPLQASDEGSLPFIAAAEGPLQDSTQPTGSKNLVQALQQTLQQLTNLVAQGKTAIVDQASALTDPVKNALQSMLMLAASNGSGKQQNRTAALDTKKADITAVGSSASQNEPALSAAEIQPEIRKTAVPLRNPVWQFQTPAGTESGQAGGTAAAPVVESAEAAQNGPAPVWTFLKGDNAMIQTSTPSNAAPPAQVPVQQFADQIGKYLVKQFILTQGNGTAEAKISLHPEHLGQVDIKIMLQNGQLTAQFMTESGVSRDLLENQMSQLRTALQAQGLQVEKMEVVQQPSSPATASFQQNQGQPGSGQNGGSGNRRGNPGVYENSAEFEAELERTAYLRESGYGSSLNVTA
jgi:flagellar hook-length control protein FliK